MNPNSAWAKLLAASQITAPTTLPKIPPINARRKLMLPNLTNIRTNRRSRAMAKSTFQKATKCLTEDIPAAVLVPIKTFVPIVPAAHQAACRSPFCRQAIDRIRSSGSGHAGSAKHSDDSTPI